MADVSRQEKLAAAKKKLKKFQKVKDVKTPNGSPAPDTKKQATKSVKHVKEVQNGPKRSEISHSTSKLSQINHSNGSGSNSEPSHVVKSVKTTASTERIHQLSRQINGIITESTSYFNGIEDSEAGDVSDLEGRNRDLASLLEDHGKKNQHMNKQLDQLKLQNKKLNEQLEGEKKNHEEKIKRELGSLKDQLQVQRNIFLFQNKNVWLHVKVASILQYIRTKFF